MNVGIYKIINIVDNKVYIGCSKNLRCRKSKHLTTLQKNIHKNQYLQNAYNKYGKDNLLFEIIEECEEKDLYIRENFWATKFNSCNREYGYNLRNTENGNYSSFSQESIEKMRNSHLGVKLSEIHKQNISLSNTGRIVSNSIREKLSIKNKGKKLSEEHKSKISKSHINKNLSEETKNKLSELGKNRKHSEQSKLKMSNMKKGHIVSEETKNKIRESLLKRNKKLCQILI